YNIKTRTDTVPGNEWLGYDPTSPAAEPELKCTKDGDGTYADDGTGTGHWTCNVADPAPAKSKLSDRLVQHMRSQILNNAAGSDCCATGVGPTGHALTGDAAAAQAVDGQTDSSKADPAWAPLVAKEVAGQAVEEAKVRAVGEAASAGVQAYGATLPDDGGVDA